MRALREAASATSDGVDALVRVTTAASLSPCEQTAERLELDEQGLAVRQRDVRRVALGHARAGWRAAQSDGTSSFA